MTYDLEFSKSLARLALSSKDEFDWPELDRFVPLQVIPAGGGCRRVIFMTKWWQFHKHLSSVRLPDDISIIQRASLPMAAHVRLIRAHLQECRAPLYFVGDLDPFDLTLFSILKRGGLNGETSDEPELDVRYLGIDDEWLALCERRQDPRLTTESAGRLLAMRSMSPFESENFRWLASWLPILESTIGVRCFALLESGHALDIEGATNPSIYSSEFSVELGRRLFIET